MAREFPCREPISNLFGFRNLLNFPSGGGRLEVLGRIPIHATGQAFAFGPCDPTRIYTILKRSREVIVERISLDPSLIP